MRETRLKTTALGETGLQITRVGLGRCEADRPGLLLAPA
jgi:hypothetical protein